ncbi:unnamed protein product [Parnassius apollo]|uniref:(apollo) hypothetical protein n=1 Tax=Parnassius apollo TaxID=110799 RepID=A0A8S3WVG3_PARAO|nr:unnamed protein product [Parnassius apollo]
MEDEKNLASIPIIENSCSMADRIVKDRPSSNEISMDEDTLLETSDNSDDTYLPSEHENAYNSKEQRVRLSRIRMKPERFVKYVYSGGCV